MPLSAAAAPGRAAAVPEPSAPTAPVDASELTFLAVDTRRREGQVLARAFTIRGSRTWRVVGQAIDLPLHDDGEGVSQGPARQAYRLVIAASGPTSRPVVRGDDDVKSLLQWIGLGTVLFIGTCCYLAFNVSQDIAHKSDNDVRIHEAAEDARKRQVDKLELEDKLQKQAAEAGRKRQVDEVYAAASQSPIDPGELIAYYSRNEVAGDTSFKDRVLAIRGRVSMIGKDILNTPYVTFDGGSNTFRCVQCMFEKKDEPELAQLAPGTEVVIAGVCKGMMGNILIRNSRIIRSLADRTAPSSSSGAPASQSTGGAPHQTSRADLREDPQQDSPQPLGSICEAVRRGDVQVSVLVASVGTVQLIGASTGRTVESGGIYLRILVEVANLGEQDPVDVLTWSKGGASLRDDRGTTYSTHGFPPTYSLKGGIERESLEPGAKVLDTLVFERPHRDVERLILQLDGANCGGGEDPIRFEIAASDIRR